MQSEKVSTVLDIVDVEPIATPKERSLANLKRGNNRKGVPNKNTKALKDMILGALSDAGGQQYLADQAMLNPGAFMALVGKVLPTELKNADAGGFVIHVTTGVPRD